MSDAGEEAFESDQPAHPPERRPGLLMVTVDQTLSIVSHGQIEPDTADEASAVRAGGDFADLFPDEPLRSAVAARIGAVLSGVPAMLDLKPEEALHPGLTRLVFLPRFRDGERQRGFFLLAEDPGEVEAARRRADALAERMAAILSNAADVIVLTSADGRIEEVNEAVRHLLGWDPRELIGQPLENLMEEPYRSLHRSYIDRYLLSGQSGILNVGPRPLPARHRDGSVVAIELSIGEAWIGGERKFVGICRGTGDRLRQRLALEEANRALEAKVAELHAVSADLEASRKQSQDLARSAQAAQRAAEAASRAKSRFLATISHELRTPLNGVLAVADVLARRDLPPEALELTEIMRRSGRDLLSLLNEILDFSRAESGAMTLIAEPFSLNDLLESLVSIWALAASARGLDFRIERAGLPERIVGDPGRLKQILSNLLNNAIKFTPKGHVLLDVRAAPAGPGFVALKFVVSDTGPGLGEDVRAHLFEPFVMGASEHARRDAGTGLGLAISRELVGLMNGAIRAETPPAGGTALVVELELPIGMSEDGGVVLAPADAPRSVEGARILVAEDHPVNQRVIALVLDQIGASYTVVDDGAAAVAAADGERFDVILMDVRMPVMDGLEATRTIRAGAGPNMATPIVAVTADATPEGIIGMTAAGMDAVASKPITLLDLTRAIETAIGAPGPGGPRHGRPGDAVRSGRAP